MSLLSLVTMILHISILIYLVLMFGRLVRAVEFIAEKIGNSLKI